MSVSYEKRGNDSMIGTHYLHTMDVMNGRRSRLGALAAASIIGCKNRKNSPAIPRRVPWV